jgi:hypothetical protein
MNLNPDNIEKYKQDMMNMYRASAQSSPQTRSEIAPSNAGTPAYIPDTGYIEAPKFPGIPDTGAIAPPQYQTPDTQPIAPYPIAPPEVQVPDTGPIEIPPDIQVPDTGYIEIPKTGEELGYLRTQVYASNRAIPIEGALVLITEVKPGGRTDLVRMLVTDESGYTDTVPLPVPVYDLDRFPDPVNKPFRDYRLSVYKEGYYIVPEVKIPIFAGVKSLQPIQMVPLRENEERINILPKPFADAIREQNAAADAAAEAAAAAENGAVTDNLPTSNPAVEQLENPPVGNVG